MANKKSLKYKLGKEDSIFVPLFFMIFISTATVIAILSLVDRNYSMAIVFLVLIFVAIVFMIFVLKGLVKLSDSPLPA